MQLRVMTSAMVAATALILTANIPMGLAQSMPAGQMSYRLQRKPILPNPQAASPNDATSNAGRTRDERQKTADEQKNEKKAANQILRKEGCVKTPDAQVAGSDAPNTPPFLYRPWFPVTGPGCGNEAIFNFFAVSGNAEAASNVKYLYNAQQSTSQITADLLTATFPLGFQAVLAGTATAGSSQPATSTPSSGSVRAVRSDTQATDPGSTDSVTTAVAKIQAGGDFNLRFPSPIYYKMGDRYGMQVFTSPNVGFNIDKFGAQSTITESTEYSVNVPLEFYAQTRSIDSTSGGMSSAILFLDVKPAAELISSQLAKKIGLTSERGFFLGQASLGLEFAQSFRISLQYLYGPEQIYVTPDSSGTTKSRIGGFHLAVSFSPQKSK